MSTTPVDPGPSLDSARVVELAPALMAKVLEPYQKKGCIYVRQAWIETDEKSPYWPKVKARARFSITESSYIDATGHFNAAEFCICYNQLTYLYGAYLTHQGLLPGTQDLTHYGERQLPGMLIKEFSSRYLRAINAGAFMGEVWTDVLSEREGYWRYDMQARFWDDAGGKAEGTVVGAILKAGALQRGQGAR